MAIPTYQDCMLPLLKLCQDGQQHSVQDCLDYLASSFHISEEQKNELLPNSHQTRLANRAAWAKISLTKAALLNSPSKGIIQITQRGLEALAQNPPKIDKSFLMQYPEYARYCNAVHEHLTRNVNLSVKNNEEMTPLEILHEGNLNLRSELADELLDRLKQVPPSRFEQIVVELLVRMGYGGTLKDAGQAVGRSGDGGIDSIIKEDRLGLDAIFVQAKRWEGTVSRPEIQKFAGALQGHRARKGVFITTSSFSHEAKEYVKNIDSKIVLIDGEQLAQLHDRLQPGNLGGLRVRNQTPRLGLFR